MSGSASSSCCAPLWSLIIPGGADGLARLAASQMAVLAAWRRREQTPDERRGDDALETAGDALAGGAEGAHVGHGQSPASRPGRPELARGAGLWELGGERRRAGPPSRRRAAAATSSSGMRRGSGRQSGDRRLVVVEWDGEREWVVTLRLDESPAALLQLVFDQPSRQPEKVKALEVFAGRARRALRAGRRADRTRSELERTRALVGVVGQAIAQLSLSHTWRPRSSESPSCSTPTGSRSTCGRRRLLEAAGRGLAGPHTPVGAASGRARARPAARARRDVDRRRAADPRLAPVREQLAETGIDAAVGLPLASARI